jgi:hypothetical protein
VKKRNSYRVRNWTEYNAGLKQRGSLTFWLNDEVLTAWYNQTPTGRRGASYRYSDIAIETVMTLKSIYHLAGRQAVGLVESIFQLMGVGLTVPEHSTLSRRLSGLAVCLPVIPKTGARHVVVDATGVKIYGEGEWQTRQHGVSKRRTWRKLHLAVDEQTGEILAAEVSRNDKKDSQLLEELLTQIAEDIDQVSADGAYDSRECYRAIAERQARAAIPPRKGARIWQHGNCTGPPHPRDENLRLIRVHGRKKWQRLCNYHRRSLAESTMFRFKSLFDSKAFSRQFSNQVNELKLKCKVLNQMIQLAKPDSYLVS